MPWPPFYTLDLLEAELLPLGWDDAARRLATGPDLQMIIPRDPDPWHFALVEGDVVRREMGWAWELYHGALRDFSSRSFGCPLHPAARVRSAMTLNVLDGKGAEQEWHRDSNPVTGMIFIDTLAESEGGMLRFRSAAGDEAELRPRAGLFVCFEGPVLHCVTPLTKPRQRLTLPMNYYHSATDQPFPPDLPEDGGGAAPIRAAQDPA